MYICPDCGRTYEDEEVVSVYKEDHISGNVFLCRPITCESFVEVADCDCGCELEKAVPCENCGSWVEDGNTLCEDCLQEYKTIDVALDIGGEWDGCVSLNGFMLSFYSREDIEQILLDSIRNESEEKVRRAVEKYCNEDKECFKECAERKWKEER